MTIAAFLVAMVGPLLARMLTALGVSLITITGLVATAATLKTLMISNLNAVPMDGLELAGLFGVWTCIGRSSQLRGLWPWLRRDYRVNNGHARVGENDIRGC
jgi:hypothetical protein